MLSGAAKIIVIFQRSFLCQTLNGTVHANAWTYAPFGSETSENTTSEVYKKTIHAIIKCINKSFYLSWCHLLQMSRKAFGAELAQKVQSLHTD